MNAPTDVHLAPWRERLAAIVEMVREMSTHTDPQQMVRAYAARVRPFINSDGFVALSRRGVESPRYRVTRSHLHPAGLDPWKSPELLPELEGGRLGDWLYRGEAIMIDDLSIDSGDPGFRFMEGMRSAMVVPQYDGGEALNMIIQFWKRPGAIDPERFPELVWMSNLFGRATSNLVLSRRLQEANETIEKEMRTVASIQQSLLPTFTPLLQTIDLATHYRTSRHAGGDYYDFFSLSDGRLGVLIADVAGHGTPAAVLMAIVHAIAHLSIASTTSPSALLKFVNHQLITRYATPSAAFVTAFYGVFDPVSRALEYSLAGHPPPLVRSAGTGHVGPIDGSGAGLPLGVLPDSVYDERVLALQPGDLMALYTDGITESRSRAGEFYGESRLARMIAGAPNPGAALHAVLSDLASFTSDAPPEDDQTLVIAGVR